MKEAAGEANMTVITIVLIGVVAAVGLLLVPRLMNNIKAKSCCTDGGGYVSGTQCVITPATNYVKLGDAMKNHNAFKDCMAD